MTDFTKSPAAGQSLSAGQSQSAPSPKSPPAGPKLHPAGQNRLGSAIRRWPALSIIGVLLALMAVVDITDSETNASPQDGLTGSGLSALDSSPIGGDSATATAPGAGGPNSITQETATWYCPAGWVAPQKGVDSSLVVINPDPEPVGMWVSYYPSVFEGGGLDTATTGRSRAAAGRVERQTVAASGSLAISIPGDLIPLGSSEVFISALVELDRPGALVIQLLLDRTGRSFISCAEGVASQWHFPTGTTTSDANFVLGLFNPFQDSAVVDVEFATDEGLRTPTAYSGLIVAPNSALYLDVGTESPRWPQLATSVRARSGQLAAAKLQIFDGTRGIRGANIALGAPTLEHQWLFPLGSAAGEPTAYVVYNPGDIDARVEIDFRLDFDSIIPTELLIPPGQQYTVTVNVPESDAQLPFYLSEQLSAEPVNFEAGHWAVVRTLSGSGVVAEQLRSGGEEVIFESDGGVDAGPDAEGGILDELADVDQPEVVVRAAFAELGLHLAATRYITLGTFSAGAIVELEDGSLGVQPEVIAIANPSSATIARVTNLATGEEFELAPRRRILVDISDLVVMESTTTVVVAAGHALAEFRQIPEVFNR